MTRFPVPSHLRRDAMPDPRTLIRLRLVRPTVLSQDLRAELDAMPAETRRLVRMVGTLLAAASLALAFATVAQTAAYGPKTESGGVLAWVFALFVGVGVLAVFLVVLSLVRTPSRGPGSRPAGTARER
jgi:hypothetical protein